MLKKVVSILLFCAAVLAVWRISGGDVGGFLVSAWDNVVYPLIDITSNIMINLWMWLATMF